MPTNNFHTALQRLYRDAKLSRYKVVTIEFLIYTLMAISDSRLVEFFRKTNLDLDRFRDSIEHHLARNEDILRKQDPLVDMNISPGLSALLNFSKKLLTVSEEKNIGIDEIDAGVVFLMIFAWGESQMQLASENGLFRGDIRKFGRDKIDLEAYSYLVEKGVTIKHVIRFCVSRSGFSVEEIERYDLNLTAHFQSLVETIYQKCRIDYEEVQLNRVGKRYPPSAQGRPNEQKDDKQHQQQQQQQQGEAEGMLKFEDFTVNLNERAMEKSREPLIGRQEEVDRCIQVLCKKRKNNPLFVGEPGVGKTALAEGLAQRVVDGKVPDKLKDSVIYSLQLTDVLAGTKYRGDFEERMKVIIKSISETPGAILFIDEIHTLVGAGATTNSTLDASNMMKPALANGALRCIGATTYSEYKKYFEKDKALSRRFHTIDVPEPSIDETVKILMGLKDIYESFHNVSYSGEAIKAAATLSAKYLNDRFLPDKAIDILDEVGAQAQTPKYDSTAGPKKISKSHIESIVSSIARIPLSSVTQTEKDKLRNLESALKGRIFGQDSAIRAVVDTIKLSKSGLGNPDKPMGSFLFAGPTGVGKTELCKQLAEQLGLKLLRFDMSEYSDVTSVNKLIGVAPGYIGFEQLGLLTDQVQNNPHSVLLLDELEKAHHDIFNVLLQVLDYGKLTDNNGRQVDFRHVIVVMTTNVGAETIDFRGMGFAFDETDMSDCEEAVKKFFSPEFRNRIDHIVSFKPLSRETVRGIVKQLLDDLKNSIKAKSINLSFTAELVEWLIDRGHDTKMGARPLKRIIQNEILHKLSDEILFGNLTKGGDVQVTADEENGVELVFKRKRGSGRASTRRAKTRDKT